MRDDPLETRHRRVTEAKLTECRALTESRKGNTINERERFHTDVPPVPQTVEPNWNNVWIPSTATARAGATSRATASRDAPAISEITC